MQWSLIIYTYNSRGTSVVNCQTLLVKINCQSRLDPWLMKPWKVCTGKYYPPKKCSHPASLGFVDNVICCAHANISSVPRPFPMPLIDCL